MVLLQNRLEIYYQINHHIYLFIIHSNHGHIFGGFMTFDINNKSSNDHDAFVFILSSIFDNQSPQIFELKDSKKNSAVKNYFYDGKGLLFQFGLQSSAISIFNYCNENEKNYCIGGSNCTYDLSSGNILCGGHVGGYGTGRYIFSVKDIEVYHISK